MVPVTSLWLPILVSAVIVFVASSIVHMALPFHRNDLKKLPREDYKRKLGAAFNLREFHERFMTNGIAPIWAHRQLMLPGDTSAVIR